MQLESEGLVRMEAHRGASVVWLSPDDIVPFNRALEPLDLQPTRTPEEARQTGRYTLENDERVDVLVARSALTTGGERIDFGELWDRRRAIGLGNSVIVNLPEIEDLIRTKRIASRPKDLEDIRLLEVLKTEDLP